MTRTKKILIWVISGAGILLFCSPRWRCSFRMSSIPTQSAGAWLAELETRYHIHSEHIDIRFLPSPRMVMHGVRTTVPEIFTASVETVSLHPKILPLFTGNFSPAEIELLNPRITAKLPEQAPEASAKASFQRLLRLREIIPQFQATLFAAMPGVVIDARNGGLELYSGQNRVFFFEHIDVKNRHARPKGRFRTDERRIRSLASPCIQRD